MSLFKNLELSKIPVEYYNKMYIFREQREIY